MQTAPDPTNDLVRAIRGDGLDAAFRPTLETAVALHRHVLCARVVSARMAALQRSAKIGYHAASVGDEAVVVGAALAAADTDWIFPGARDWYAALARGMPLATYVHHAFGSAADPAKGHQTPDHAPARRWNVVPPSGVAGAHVLQAAGAAWAAKIAAKPTRMVALFDAAVVESGDFHNAMNFAGVFKAPVVFVCRSRPGARGSERVVDRAVAYGLASSRVDGADVLAVHGVVRAALARASEGKGATLVEAVAPAPSGLASLTDARLGAGDVLDLGDHDPLVLLREYLGPKDGAALAAEPATAKEIGAELDEAIAAAERAGPPALGTIFEDVYATVPAHLAAQELEARKLMTQRTGG